MNYHTSFHPSMQNDNGWTRSGHQLVAVLPRLSAGELLNAFKAVRKEFAFVLMSLEGVRRVSPAARNTFCTTVSLCCGFVRTLWSCVCSKSAASRLPFKAEVQKDDAVEEAGGTALGVQQNHISHAAGVNVDAEQIPNAIIARRLALINISPTLAFVPSPLS